MANASFTKTGKTALVFPVNPRYPRKTTVHTGSLTAQTEGGDVYVEERGGPYAVMELRFEGLSSAAFDGGFNYSTATQSGGTQSLVGWFIAVWAQGRDSFTYTDPEGNSHDVGFADENLEFSLADYGLYDGTLRLRKKVGG